MWWSDGRMVVFRSRLRSARGALGTGHPTPYVVLRVEEADGGVMDLGGGSEERLGPAVGRGRHDQHPRRPVQDLGGGGGGYVEPWNNGLVGRRLAASGRLVSLTLVSVSASVQPGRRRVFPPPSPPSRRSLRRCSRARIRMFWPSGPPLAPAASASQSSTSRRTPGAAGGR